MKQPDPNSARSKRRAERNFTGSRAQRRNAKYQASNSVVCNYAGTSPQQLAFEGTSPTAKGQGQQGLHMQYRGGSNKYHA